MIGKVARAVWDHLRNHPDFGFNSRIGFLTRSFVLICGLYVVFLILVDRLPFVDTLGFDTALMVSSIGPALAAMTVVFIITFISRFTARKDRAVLSAPGSHLASALTFLMTKKDYERVFAQSLRDMREEYFEALQEGRLWLARWRHIQFYLSAIAMLGLLSGSKLVRLVQAAWKLSGPG
ncbi:MAG: hypothetical protein JJ911_12685 [Rhizobiaceae bacterium]|nr:hypothetical protein [Rhizobiaceae bacterium]